MKLLFANKKLQLMLCIVVLLFAACELIDPTKVENPSITQEKLFADATGGAQPLITGLEYAYADAVNRAVYFLEVVSDDYVNTSTYISTQLDNPRLITPNDQYLGDAREIYFKLETLHALANFGLSTVLPKDEQSTDADKSATLFFRAMSVIMLCENFQAFPLEEGGEMIRSEDAIKLAIEDLNTAYSLYSGGEHSIDIKLATGKYNLPLSSIVSFSLIEEGGRYSPRL